MKHKYIVPVITALNKDGSIDTNGNVTVYRHLMKNGVDGFLVMGSTGEFCFMSKEERMALIEIASQELAGKTEFYVGTGGMDAGDTIELSDFALNHGADGVMIVTPYYLPMDARDIIAFYDRVVPQISGSVYIYNIPQATSQDITPEIVLELCRKHANIVGIKDSVIDFAHTNAVMQAVRPEFPDFQVFTGMDFNFAYTVSAGGNGCIGGLANVVPELCNRIVCSADAGDAHGLEKLQNAIVRLMPIYGIGGKSFIPSIKKAMQLRGVPIEDTCKFPVQPIPDSCVIALKDLMEKENLI